MSEATSIEIMPTWPEPDGRYHRTTWLTDLDKDLPELRRKAKVELMRNSSEEGIIIIRKLKYNI